MARNLPNLRQESSSLVSTSLTHSGDDEDSEDSGIISLFFLLESPESSHRTHVRNACVFHWRWRSAGRAPPAGFNSLCFPPTRPFLGKEVRGSFRSETYRVLGTAVEFVATGRHTPFGSIRNPKCGAIRKMAPPWRRRGGPSKPHPLLPPGSIYS